LLDSPSIEEEWGSRGFSLKIVFASKITGIGLQNDGLKSIPNQLSRLVIHQWVGAMSIRNSCDLTRHNVRCAIPKSVVLQSSPVSGCIGAKETTIRTTLWVFMARDSMTESKFD